MNQSLVRFPSFPELQSTHDELLERQENLNDSAEAESPFWADVQTFVAHAQATGALLDVYRDRRAAQSILNFWAGALYAANRDVPEARLAEFDPTLAPELPDEPSPYQGLAAFGEPDHEFFFGRERLIRKMVARLQDGERLLAAVGASGSGKSSVVLAGLLPALKSGALPDSETWRYVRMVPGAEPLSNLAHAIQPTEEAEPRSEPVASGTESLSVVDGLRKDPDYVAKWLETNSHKPVVFVVDQFEELFTVCEDEQEQQQFADQLVSIAQAPNAQHIVVLTIRTDFVNNVVKLPDLLPLFRAGRVDVEALDINELRATIEKPAAKVGLRFDEGIVDDLVSKILGERAGLPLLQFTLLKLWENRQRNRITREVYEEVGSPLEALERSAEAFYTSLIPGEQRTAKRILLKLVQPGEGREVTSKRIPLVDVYRDGEAEDRIDHVLYRLIFEERLVKLSGSTADLHADLTPEEEHALSGLLSDEGPGDEVVQIEIAHEALVRNWPRLVDWLEDERRKYRQRRRITEDAEHWESLERDPDALYSITLLAEAQRVIEESDIQLSQLEREFLEASQAHIEWEQEQEVTRRVELELAEAKAEQQARRARRLRRVAVVLFILFLIPTVILVVELLMRQSDWKPVEYLARDPVMTIAFAPPSSTKATPTYCIGTSNLGVACSDDGQRWNIYQQGLPTTEPATRGIRAVGKLAIDSANPKYIYAFLLHNGIYKSDNGGVSWRAVNTGLPDRDFDVKKLIVHQPIVAAVVEDSEFRTRSLYVSLDAGEHWRLVVEPDQEPMGQVQDISFVLPNGNSPTIYLLIATPTGIYSAAVESSWDWQRLDTPRNVSLIAVDSHTSDHVYFTTYDRETRQSELILYRWSQGKNRTVTPLNGRPRVLTVFSPSTGSTTLYLLLEGRLFQSDQVIEVRVDGKLTPRGGAGSSLFELLTLPFTFDLLAVPSPDTNDMWLLLGHTDGLLQHQEFRLDSK